MAAILYISLCIALTSLGIFIALNYYNQDRSNLKRWLAIGSGIFYTLFVVIAMSIHLEHKVAIKPVPKENREEFAKVAASSNEIKQPTAVKASNLSVKVRALQSTLNPNKKINLQILVVNNWNHEVPDLRMKFLSGELREYFEVSQIKSNGRIYIFSDLIALGTLKSGESRMLEFELIPKSSAPYLGEIVWQAGNTYIVNEDNKPLNSLINLEPGENNVATEDADFASFQDLKPIAEFSEVTEEQDSETNENSNDNEQEQDTSENSEQDELEDEEAEDELNNEAEDDSEDEEAEDELNNEAEDDSEDELADENGDTTVMEDVY